MFISVRALSHTKSLQYRLAEMALCEPVLFECIHGKLFGTDYVFYVNGSPIYDTDLNIALPARARSSAKNRRKCKVCVAGKTSKFTHRNIFRWSVMYRKYR